jgi:DNA-binding protein HU-beta
MNRKRLIEAVAEKTGDSNADISAVIDAFIEMVTRVVSDGHTIQLSGFGSFSTSNRPARRGRNPSTGETVAIAASKSVKFTAGKAFKDAINGK